MCNPLFFAPKPYSKYELNPYPILSAMFKCQIIILWRSVAWIFNLDILSMHYWISVWSSKISKTKKSFEKAKRISSEIGTKEERPNITMGENRIMIRVILSKMIFFCELSIRITLVTLIVITLTVQNLPDRSNKFIIRIDSAPERFSTSPIIRPLGGIVVSTYS